MSDIWAWPRATVVDHYDGDTVYCDIDLGMQLIKKRCSVRLIGINAPEMRPLQPGAKEALAELKLLLPVGEKVSLASVYYDKYGGRVDAIVTRAKDLLNINDAMVATGLVVKRDYS